MTSQVVTLLAKALADGSVAFVDDQNIIWQPTRMTFDASIDPHSINSFTSSEEIVETDISTFKLVLCICLSLFCILMGGITSGLNVSLLSVDQQKLDLQIRMEKNRLKEEVKEKHGLPESPRSDSSQLQSERIEMCEKVKPLLKDHHLLLVTILLANASAMEALPVFLDDLVAPWFAVVISVTFVLIFGEIIPQALFASEPILVGSKLAGLVRAFQIVLFPIAKPIAWLLDQCIPVHRATYYTPDEIEAMIDNANFAHPDQKLLITGAFKLENLTVEDAAIPWKDVIRFPATMTLNQEGLRVLHASGCSRVPVYDKGREENIVGLCLVKNLIPVHPSSHVKLIDKSNSIPLVVSKDMNLLDCLNLFQERKSHFALVPNNHDDVARVQECYSKHGESIPDDITFFGIITLEDVIEEVIQEEIYDETDSQVDVYTSNLGVPDMSKSISSEYEHLHNISDNKDFVDVMKRKHIKHRRRLDRLKNNANKVKNKGNRSSGNNMNIKNKSKEEQQEIVRGAKSLIRRVTNNRLIASADNVVEYKVNDHIVSRVYDEIKEDTVNDGYGTGQEFDYRGNSTDIGTGTGTGTGSGNVSIDIKSASVDNNNNNDAVIMDKRENDADGMRQPLLKSGGVGGGKGKGTGTGKGDVSDKKLQNKANEQTPLLGSKK